MSSQTDIFPKNYDTFLQSLKARIRQAQLKAALSVNRKLVLLYWEIGREILARQIGDSLEDNIPGHQKAWFRL